ncbi:insulinase family protein [Candidatus Saccharibacteria bacterium]|nr:insulinase family protein [Candidatus Saccharibacteria bacterium]
MKHIIEEVKLKSGARGLLIDAPGSSVLNTHFTFRAGNRFTASHDIYEVAHLMEHMAFGANSQFEDEQAYEQEFTKNGAYHNAWTSDYFITYEAECADFEWERILALQELAITTPQFNEKEMAAEKGNVRSELTGYQNDYSRLIWPKLQQELGENVLTYAERIKTLRNIQLSDVQQHHDRTHTAKNLQFIICGDLSERREKIINMLEAWKLPEGERLDFPKTDYHQANPVLIRRKDASNLSFGFSFMLNRALCPNEQESMGALNHILNGTMSSKIFGTARHRGIVYGMGSNTNSDSLASNWDFDGEVNSENVEELFDLIAIELSKVINGDIAPEEITQAKQYALGRIQMLAQTADQIANHYLRDYVIMDKVFPIERMPEMIDSIDKRTIVALARSFFESGISGISVVGNINKAFVDELWERILAVI